MKTTTKTTDEREIVISRMFNAPRQDVWRAWTEADRIEQWWGPRGFITRVNELNFEPGGQFQYTMIDDKGNEYPSVGEFRKINEPERIVATDEFSEEMLKAMPDLPTGMITTTTFGEVDGQAKVTIAIMHQSVEDRNKHQKMGVVDGFNQQLDKLEEYLNF